MNGGPAHRVGGPLHQVVAWIDGTETGRKGRRPVAPTTKVDHLRWEPRDRVRDESSQLRVDFVLVTPDRRTRTEGARTAGPGVRHTDACEIPVCLVTKAPRASRVMRTQANGEGPLDATALPPRGRASVPGGLRRRVLQGRR